MCVPNRSAVLASTATHSFFLLLTEDSVFTLSSDVDKESDTTPAPKEDKKGADDIQKKKISQLLYGRAINNGQKSTAR